MESQKIKKAILGYNLDELFNSGYAAVKNGEISLCLLELKGALAEIMAEQLGRTWEEGDKIYAEALRLIEEDAEIKEKIDGDFYDYCDICTEESRDRWQAEMDYHHDTCGALF